MAEFRFADWNPTSGTVPAYFVGESGTITVGEVIVLDGKPVDGSTRPLDDDNKTTRLTGWRHTECASFNEGRVLVPLKGSRA